MEFRRVLFRSVSTVSTLDLETVLTTIVSRANQLSDADAAEMYEYDGQAQEFYLRATQNLEQEFVELLRETPIRKGEGATGRMAETREPTQIPDIGQEGAYQSRLRDPLIRLGYRALLAVPLPPAERIIGRPLGEPKNPSQVSCAGGELSRTVSTHTTPGLPNTA